MLLIVSKIFGPFRTIKLCGRAYFRPSDVKTRARPVNPTDAVEIVFKIRNVSPRARVVAMKGSQIS